ncbi:MAG: threonine/serine exporter family protein [Oscillospiraceae bacterium]|nr:threonine/serine exporter family protein [Oscillospiraceae bacterium]
MELTTLLLEVLASGAASVAYAALFQVDRRHYVSCAITGAMGWLGYRIGQQLGMSVPMARFFATLPMAALARWFAITRRAPVIVFLLGGIFPLVPGSGIYYTAYYFIQGNSAMMAMKGVETFKVAVGIALGIALVLSIPLKGHTSSFMLPKNTVPAAPPPADPTREQPAAK